MFSFFQFFRIIQNSALFVVYSKQCNTVMVVILFLLTSQLHASSTDFNGHKFKAFSFQEREAYIHQFPFWNYSDKDSKFVLFSEMFNISMAQKDNVSISVIQYYSCWNLDSIQLQQLFNKTKGNILLDISHDASLYGNEINEVILPFYSRGYINTRPNLPNLEDQYLNILETYDLMKSKGFEKFEYFCSDCILFSMAKFMFEIEDIDRAFEYLTIAEKYVSKDDRGALMLVFIYNHLQVYWKKKNNSQKTIEYANKIIDFLEHTKLSADIHKTEWKQFWIGLSNLEIAHQFIKEGKTKEAELYAENGLVMVNQIVYLIQNFPTYLIAEFDALQTTISIKLALNKTEEIEPLLLRSDTILTLLNPPHIIELSNQIIFNQNYSIFFEINKAFENSLQYSKIAKVLEDSLETRNDARKFERISKRLMVERYVDELNEVKQLNKTIQVIITTIALLIFIVLVYVFSKYIISNRQDKLKSVKLQRATNNIQYLTQNIKKKEIKNIELLHENRKQIEESNQKETLEVLLTLQILTPADWVNYKIKFEGVFPGFIDAQKNEYQKITHAELRLLILEHLGLNSVEIADKLGVNANTIHQTRRRFKKKYESVLS